MCILNIFLEVAICAICGRQIEIAVLENSLSGVPFLVNRKDLYSLPTRHLDYKLISHFDLRETVHPFLHEFGHGRACGLGYSLVSSGQMLGWEFGWLELQGKYNFSPPKYWEQVVSVGHLSFNKSKTLAEYLQCCNVGYGVNISSNHLINFWMERVHV